jgi:hypothetical protein
MWKRILREERGSSLILAGLALTVMLAAAGVVVDGGTLYVTKAEMKKAANAAVLSAAQELTNKDGSVRSVLTTVLKDHGEDQSVKSTSVDMGRRVRVELSRPVRLGFSGIFGIKQADVAVSAAADIGPMGSAVGAVPVGVDESVPLNYGQEYELKDGPGQGSTGFYGILDFTARGGGATEYEAVLTNGFDGELTVGQIVGTKEGVVAGKTQKAVQSRIDRCPNPSGDLNVRECSRIMLVPVYRYYDKKHVEIISFAFFYLTQPADKDNTIHGKFIKRADTGFAKPGTADKGAYAIRLTE